MNTPPSPRVASFEQTEINWDKYVFPFSSISQSIDSPVFDLFFVALLVRIVHCFDPTFCCCCDSVIDSSVDLYPSILDMKRISHFVLAESFGGGD